LETRNKELRLSVIIKVTRKYKWKEKQTRGEKREERRKKKEERRQKRETNAKE
jgi:hypothetical protein